MAASFRTRQNQDYPELDRIINFSSYRFAKQKESNSLKTIRNRHSKSMLPQLPKPQRLRNDFAENNLSDERILNNMQKYILQHNHAQHP